MADYVKLRTHVRDHERFLEAGPVARDLYVWGMLYAGHLETDGAIPMVALLAAPWGAGGKANIKHATKLVEVGLWERTDSGYQVLKWTEQGNASKAELRAARDAAKERMRKRRSSAPPAAGSGEVRANFSRSDSEVPSSLSLCTSGSGSPEGMQGEVPSWFAVDAVATAEMAGVKVTEVPARWLEYRAGRERKGWAMGTTDAAAWLTNVMRREALDEARRPKARGAEATKQPTDPTAPWMKLPEVG